MYFGVNFGSYFVHILSVLEILLKFYYDWTGIITALLVLVLQAASIFN